MALALLQMLAQFVLPVLVVGAVLYPAYKVSGGARADLPAYAGWCIIVAIVGMGTAVLGVFPLFAVSQGSGNGTQLALMLAAVWSASFLAGGSAILGVIFSRMAVLPGVIAQMSIAGGALALFAIVASVLPWSWAQSLTGPAVAVMWIVVPPAIFYSRALRRRTTLRLYLRGVCPKCRTPDSIKTGLCTTCYAVGQLCYRCRRFSKRPPGKACTHCDATLGKRCWRCQYELEGITGDRCPECGVWKPTPADPPANPASPPASLY